MSNLKIEMGVGLIRAGAAAVAAFQALSVGILGAVSAYAKFSALVYDIKAATTFGDMSKMAKTMADDMRAAAKAADEAAQDLAGKATANWGIATASAEDLVKATNAGTAAIREQAKATETQYQSVAKVIPIIERWGEANLKLASSRYAESLKVEAATIEQLRAGLFQGEGGLVQVFRVFGFAALHFVAAENIHRLRGEAEVGADGHGALSEGAHDVFQPQAAFELDHIGPGPHERG